MKATFFQTPADLRDWLDAHRGTVRELLIGFYKKGSGKAGITYQEALDEALCVGWIDGVRRTIDHQRYTIRFAPRKTTSAWSAINIARVAELTRQGRMRASGLQAFDARDPKRSGYSYERNITELDPGSEKKLRSNRKAWAYFQSQPPSYQRTARWWVASAKKEETRARRLEALISDSAKEQRIKPLSYGTDRRKG
ncbi:MAG: YdeI/OmpD-associated family protein [Gemmatimonadales bacterium]